MVAFSTTGTSASGLTGSFFTVASASSWEMSFSSSSGISFWANAKEATQRRAN